MRPLELRLRNFRSFFGDNHRFDFRGRRLVGIVGPIGSGKTTILDAIAFALYGRTPRIGHATKSLIHQRADNAAVLLRFEVEGDVWEVVRNLRRNGPSQHALYRLPVDEPDVKPGEKVTLAREVIQRIEDLLGLDFHGFGRSVLLAQGRFAQFLGASPAERDKVLKGVFGYERVGEIRELARAAASRASQATKVLDVRIEHAEAAKTRLDRRKDELADACRRLEMLEGAKPLFEELARCISEADEGRAQAERRLAALHQRSGELPDPVAGEQVVRTVERARIRTGVAERELKIIVGRLDEAAAAMDSEDYRRAVEDLDRVSQRLAKAEAEHDRTESRLAELRHEEAGLPDRLKGIKVVASAEYAWAHRVEAQREWEAAKARLDGAEAKVTSEEFIAREQRAGTAEGLIIRLAARKEAAEAAARQVARRAGAVEVDEAAVEHSRSALTLATGEREDAEMSFRDAVDRLLEAEQRLLDSRHADMAGTLRSGLVGGDTCPVCDQPVHQVPPATVGDTIAAEETVDRSGREREDAEERLRSTTGGEQAAKAELGAAKSRLASSRVLLEASREEWRQQDALIAGGHDELVRLLGKGDPEVRLGMERASIGEQWAAVGEARKDGDRKRTELDAAMEEERRVEKTLSELRARIGTLGAKLGPGFEVPEAGPDAVRAALASLHTEWRRTTARFEDALRAEQDKIDLVSTRRAEAEARVDSFRTGLDQARAARDEALGIRDQAVMIERESGRDLSDLRASLGRLGAFLDPDFQVPPEDPPAVRAALASLHAGWNSATTDLQHIVTQHRARREEAARRLDEERTTHRVEDSIGVALAEARARMQQIEADIGTDEDLTSGLVDLRRERRRYRKDARLNQRLVRDLTDARFIHFLLDEERATLADLGSEHFERLSSGRYRFTEDGAFEIVDLNSADAVRRAESLSGGETFLAALALALALAEMVGRRGGRLDAFFLDEGFGTLDPEHLDLAMEGIESLAAHREQRLVVVVSHVPELRERIEDLLELGKDAVTGDSLLLGGAAR